MANLGNDLENDILRVYLGLGAAAITVSSPGVGLLTVVPTNNPDSDGTEVTDNLYERQGPAWQITDASGETSADNDGDITWPAADTAGYTVVAIGVYSNTTKATGKLLWWGILTNPAVLVEGDQLKILAGNLDIEMA